MKIIVDDLEFNSEYFYIQNKSIVERVSFNNRTFYSKYERFYTPLTSLLLKQHQDNQVTLALPLIENEHVNYLVVEYSQENWQAFHALIKHLLKNLNIKEFVSYRNENKNLLQIFIKRPQLPLKIAYKEVEDIKHLLELKSNKSYKLLPNNNLPENYNIITFPLEKI